VSSRESKLAQRARILADLRAGNPGMTAWLEELDHQLFGAPKSEVNVLPVSEGEFASVTIINGIILYLLRTGRPVSEAELTRAMVIAKASGEEDTSESLPLAWRVEQSIRSHVAKEVILRRNYDDLIELLDPSALVPVTRKG
jgi:hypothetical protein